MEQINFLFWNTCNKLLDDQIAEIILENRIDIAFFVESPGTNVAEHLTKLTGIPFYNNSIKRTFTNLQIISRFPNDVFTVKREDNRYIVIEFRLSEFEPNLILGICHLPSKMYKPLEEDRRVSLEKFMSDVIAIENESELKSTIIFGDFNFDPFEKTFISGDILNSTMAKDVAMTGSRNVDGIERDFFYNPMWSFLGDLGKGEVNGTYFHNSGKNINYYWHILDQVLIRSCLIENFREDDLEIITKTKNYNFTRVNKNSVKIIDESLSDHLPIKFVIQKNLQNE